MSIRRAQEKDIEQIRTLLYQVNNVHADGRPDLFKHGQRKYTDEDLRRIFSNDLTPVFVYADENDQVLGYAFCVYTEVTKEHPVMTPIRGMYLDDLCVDESCQRKHVGKALYEYVEQEAKKNGCYQLTLHAWECNKAAMRFYESMGMVPLNTTMEKIL